MPTIKVTIDKFGQPKISADGFVGSACEKATAPLEAALSAGASMSRKRKPEFFGTQTGRATVKAEQ